MVEEEIDAEIDEVSEEEKDRPAAAVGAEQDAEEEPVGGPEDGDSASMPTVEIEGGGGAGEQGEKQGDADQLLDGRQEGGSVVDGRVLCHAGSETLVSSALKVA